MADESIDRANLTFEQAEGVEPLPRQLELKEISPQLRAFLWDYIHNSVEKTINEYDRTVGGRWLNILRRMHVVRLHLMVDDFENKWSKQREYLKKIFVSGEYTDIFGFLQWVMRSAPPEDFAKYIDNRLKFCRAAYRVVNGDTIVPVSAPEERETLERAFTDLRSTEFNGARQHLKLAAEAATAGDWAGCVRESIHAVEATAKSLAPGTKELGPALAKLEATGAIHKAMKAGFSSLYGFTSDEKGIRHALLDGDAANVDETDALFMLGACAAFVSYLINKGRAGGLIKQ